MLMPHYSKKVVDLMNLTNAKTTTTPAAHDMKLADQREGVVARLFPYMTAVGSLMWIGNTTQPDIMPITNLLARSTNAFTEVHITAIKCVFRYLNHTQDIGLTYSGYSFPFEIGYSDASFASEEEKFRSVSGSVFIFGVQPLPGHPSARPRPRSQPMK
jgi:hypothetical protein